MVNGLQHVGAAPDPQHQNPWIFLQVVRDGRGQVVHVADRIALPRKAIDHTGLAPIRENRELRRRLKRAVEAEAGGIPEGNFEILHHGHLAQRARAAVYDTRASDSQGLAETPCTETALILPTRVGERLEPPPPPQVPAPPNGGIVRAAGKLRCWRLPGRAHRQARGRS